MSKYTLPYYEVMEEIGETQQEIDLVNQECKNIYLGVWQGVLELCYDLYEYQVQQGIDTTFILDEQQKVWEAIYQATEDNLLDDKDIEILSPYKIDWINMMEQYYQDTPMSEPCAKTKTITKTHSAETDTEDVTIVTTTTVIKTPKKKEEVVVPHKSLRTEIMRYKYNKTKEND